MSKENKFSGFDIFIAKLLEEELKLNNLRDEKIPEQEIELILKEINKNKSVLVYGEVQSGKTARIKKLRDKVIEDSIFDIIIVLGGTNSILNNQSISRLDGDVVKKQSKKRYLDINTINQLVPVAKDGNLVSLIIKKDYHDLFKLNEVIEQLPDRYSILLVDDEADYASLNTSKNIENPTAVSGYIKEIVSREKSKLCMFTATPYANIIDKNSELDLMVMLESNKEYTGLVQFNDKYPSVYKIVDEKSLLSEADISDLIQNALKHYLLSTVLYRINKNEDIYFEFLVNIEYEIDKIRFYMNEIEQQYKNLVSDINKVTCKEEFKDLFIQSYKEYEEEKQITINFQETINEIKSILRKLENNIIEMDGSNKQNYQSAKAGELKSPKIICSGYLASRGITFNNLLTTIMLNEPKQNNALDTLLQRARWFGYRRWFIEYMAVYISEKSKATLTDAIITNRFFRENSRNNILYLTNEIKTKLKNMSISSKLSNKRG